MKEAELKRAGNQQMRDDLKDANRQYDPVKERGWEQKYKFFSGQHMKGNFRVFARARHDPFNKDPSWGQSVIHNVAAAIERQKKTPADIFNSIDVTGDGTLNRPELKKALVGALPTLSDMEIQAIFDVIDDDNSGEVAIDEFCDALHRGRHVQVPKEKAERWRNPINRMKRFAPATVEGWDHLEGPPQGGRADKLAVAQANQVMKNLGEQLMNTPRALQHQDTTPKYHYFGGGADSRRFHRNEWLKGRATPSTPAESGTPRFNFPDPGPDLRPGFLCDPTNHAAARGFSAITPRQTTARTTKSSGS
jgi:hypothetical protein